MKPATLSSGHSSPKLVIWDDLHFFLPRFLKQFAVCAMLVAVGTGFALLFFPRGAVPWISAGITIGILPSLIAVLPSEIHYSDDQHRLLDNMREWLKRGRYKRLGNQLPDKGEWWALDYPIWQRWMPAMDVYIQSDGVLVRVRGPRTIIRQIAKRLARHQRQQRSGAKYK